MAEIRPELSEIIERIRADAAAEFPGLDTTLDRSLFDLLLMAFAGAIHESWGYLQNIADAHFAQTATGDDLALLADERGVSRVQGVKSWGTATLTTDAAWVPTVSSGRRFVRSDGFEYAATTDAAWSGSAWTVGLIASVEGVSGNYAGTVRLVEPSAGVGDVTISAASGVDAETDDELRVRLLDVLRLPPQGGTADDFRRWALGSGPLTRAWVMDPSAGAPDFTVYVADDNNDPPTPAGGDVTAAQVRVDADKPITSDPTVSAATFQDLDAAITISPNNATIQAAVDAEIDAMLLEEAGPGVDLLLSKLQEAVARSPGLVDFTITAPTGTTTATGTNVIVRGTTVFS